MQRWVLARDGLVRGYLLAEGEPDQARRCALVAGSEVAEAEAALAEAGEWLLVPEDAGLVGDGWTVGAEGRFLPPAEIEAAPHLVSGSGFLALFTPPEVAAMWQSGPEFMVAALRIAAQNEVNLDSKELGRLLALAVARGALPGARLSRITAGLPPA